MLDLYAEPHDPQRPVVCFDETSTQMLSDARPPMPAQPGLPRRQDYEYRREGTRNLFLACEPLAGWRHVSDPAAHDDFAHQMRWPIRRPVVRVANLGVPEAFPAAEAPARRLEFHYTPTAVG